MIHTESEYQSLVDKIASYDAILVNCSAKFAAMTREAKRIIDEAKAKSDQRKEIYGITDDST